MEIRGATQRNEQLAALTLLIPDDHQREPLVEAAVAGSLDDEGLVIAVVDDYVVGAAWLQSYPGCIGLLWPVCAESTQLSKQLITFAESRFQPLHRGAIIQSLLPLHSTDLPTLLMESGYVHAADLAYMSVDCDDVEPTEPQRSWDAVPYSADLLGRLVEVVSNSYRETRDCPMLNDLRSVEDVLEGYRGLGDSSDQLWFLVQSDGRDLGCLLLADHTGSDQLELVYMGLDTDARGRGWGLELTQFARRQARNRNRSRLVLAVDARNRPALDVYVAAGLSTTDMRRAYFKKLVE